MSRLADQDTTDDPSQVAALLQMLVGLRLLPEELGEDTWLRKLEEDTSDLIARQGPHTGLRNALNEVRRLASAVRDRLSIDTWRILNQLHQDMRVRQGRIQFDEVLVYLNRIITDLAAFSGMEMENMTRGHGWRFLNLGRRLERSMNLIGVLRGAVGIAAAQAGAAGSVGIVEPAARDRRQLDDLPPPLLRAAAPRTGAAPAARRRHQYARPVVSAGGSLGTHPPPAARSGSPVAHARGTLDRARARDADRDHRLAGMVRADESHARLDGLLDSLDDDLKDVSDAITYFYFSHAELRVS